MFVGLKWALLTAKQSKKCVILYGFCRGAQVYRGFPNLSNGFAVA
jgi:hypothetical protein